MGSFLKQELWESEDRDPLPYTLDQFLVTFGLSNIAVANWAINSDEERV